MDYILAFWLNLSHWLFKALFSAATSIQELLEIDWWQCLQAGGVSYTGLVLSYVHVADNASGGAMRIRGKPQREDVLLRKTLFL